MTLFMFASIVFHKGRPFTLVEIIVDFFSSSSCPFLWKFHENISLNRT